MKRLYSVYFDGHYPVGAVAITMAENHWLAALQVQQELPAELQADNPLQYLLENTHVIIDETTILLDGDY